MGADGLVFTAGSHDARATAGRHRHPKADFILLMADDALQITRTVSIPRSEIVLRASRSSGPGGQHANVTASRVEASFEVSASTALSDAQKARLIARVGPRVSAVAQEHRGQARNRELAIERLRRRLAAALAVAPARRRTRVPQSQRGLRLAAKRHRAERKRERRPPEE
jgi:ribosome-associated protein